MNKEIQLKRSYFISPQYIKRFINKKEHRSNTTIYDPNDTLPKWLRINTVPFEVKTLFEPIKAYKFMENGSYCEIIHKRDDELNSFEYREKKRYFRVVRILSYPPHKELPPGLTQALEERNYNKIEKKNQNINDLEEKII